MIKIDYKVELDEYSGPLDLLCELVLKNKIDIKSIYINKIINQYLAYMKEDRKFEGEQDSEFLIMATKLLNIKSRTILKLHIESEEEDKEDLVTALAAQLEEYIKYKRVALYFREKCNLSNSSFTRVKEEIIDLEEEFVIQGFDRSYILEGIKMILNAKPLVEEEIEEKVEDKRLEKIYKEPFIAVETKMEEIRDIINKLESTNFKEIVKGHKKGGQIASFLALLELTKVKYVITEQEDAFEDIFIKKNKNI